MPGDEQEAAEIGPDRPYRAELNRASQRPKPWVTASWDTEGSQRFGPFCRVAHAGTCF